MTAFRVRFPMASSARTLLLAATAALVAVATFSACGSADASASGASATPGTTRIATGITNADTLSDSALMSLADAGRYEGSETAPIWIVMISDFQCPYCREWHDTTLTEVRKAYVETGKARLAYLNLPLQGHRHARVLAKAGLCASAQGKFWPYANAMFAKQATVGNLADAHPMLNALADSLKLDTAAFTHCQNSRAINSLLESDLRQANQARIGSTPSFFVGQFILEGAVPFSSFRKAVDSALVIAEKKR